MRSMVNGCMKDLGVKRVVMAPNGEFARKLLNETHIDMIICDWDMPQLSGLELLSFVRAEEKYRHIPFLMLTATTEKKRVISAIEAGVSDYLSKPFQAKELEYRVIKLLRKVQLH